jgi:hypothetical protein
MLYADLEKNDLQHWISYASLLRKLPKKGLPEDEDMPARCHAARIAVRLFEAHGLKPKSSRSRTTVGREKAMTTEPDYTLGEWRAKRKISKSAHFSLKKRDLAPEEIAPPGTTIRRITAEADRAWEERMRQLAQGKVAQQEAQRRQALASIKGKLAFQSEKHPQRKRMARS